MRTACVAAAGSAFLAAAASAAGVPTTQAVRKALQEQARRFALSTGAADPDRPVEPSKTPPELAGTKAQSLILKGFLSGWTQDCAKGCGLPKPTAANIPLEAALTLPAKPGEASSAALEGSLDSGAGGTLQARVSFFAVCPYAQAFASGEACPGRYFQVQIELSGASEAFCGFSIDEHDLVPFPVLLCGGPSKAEPSARLGVTLHRKPL